MSLGRAIIDTIKGNFVSGTVKAKRVRICSSCDKLNKNNMVQTCMECGCLIQWKTAMINEQCPLKKWGK